MKYLKCLFIFSFVSFTSMSYAETIILDQVTIQSIEVGIKGSTILTDIGEATDLVNSGSYISIQLIHQPCQGLTCTPGAGQDTRPCYNEYKVLFSDHVYSDELYSMLLTAEVSQKPVTLTQELIRAESGSFYCKLESVKLAID